DLDRIKRISEKAATEIDAASDDMHRGLMTAKGAFFIRQMVTGRVLDALMALQNQDYGFKTDQDAGYDRAIVQKCAIDAFLMGLRPVGNEWNIIGRRMMPVHNGWQRKVSEIPGIASVEIDTSGPVKPWNNMGITVECTAKWVLRGVADEIKVKASIPIHKGSGIRNCQMRLERQVYEAIWIHIKGARF